MLGKNKLNDDIVIVMLKENLKEYWNNISKEAQLFLKNTSLKKRKLMKVESLKAPWWKHQQKKLNNSNGKNDKKT